TLRRRVLKGDAGRRGASSGVGVRLGPAGRGRLARRLPSRRMARRCSRVASARDPRRHREVRMWSEFRAFLLKTNVVALALAFIVGVALAAVVLSLVNDIIMPPVGLLLGGADFQSMYWNLSGKSYPNLKAA